MKKLQKCLCISLLVISILLGSMSINPVLASRQNEGLEMINFLDGATYNNEIVEVKLVDIFECSYLADIVATQISDQLGYEVSLTDLIDIKYLQLVTEVEIEAFIQSFSGLEYLSNLQVLTVFEANAITDLMPLRDLTNLQTLVLEGVQASDLSAVSSLSNLTQLAFTDSQVNNIDALSSLTNLQEVILSGNNISDLTPLASASLSNLSRLALDNNQISDLQPLSNLTQLTTLTLNNNNIRDLSPLSGLTLLSNLAISDNKVSDLRPLSGLSNLFWLTALNQTIQLDPVVLGDETNFNLFFTDGTVPYTWGVRGFTFEDQILVWHVAGANSLQWEIMGGGPATFSDFSGTVMQTALDEAAPEVDADSITAVQAFLAANTPTNRIRIPATATTEAEILAAITVVLNNISNVDEDVTVSLLRQANTAFEANQIVNISISLTSNPTYIISNQTIYFQNDSIQSTLPATGMIAQNNLLVGFVAINSGVVFAIFKGKKK